MKTVDLRLSVVALAGMLIFAGGFTVGALCNDWFKSPSPAAEIVVLPPQSLANDLPPAVKPGSSQIPFYEEQIQQLRTRIAELEKSSQQPEKSGEQKVRDIPTRLLNIQAIDSANWVLTKDMTEFLGLDESRIKQVNAFLYQARARLRSIETAQAKIKAIDANRVLIEVPSFAEEGSAIEKELDTSLDEILGSNDGLFLKEVMKTWHKFNFGRPVKVFSIERPVPGGQFFGASISQYLYGPDGFSEGTSNSGLQKRYGDPLPSEYAPIAHLIPTGWKMNISP